MYTFLDGLCTDKHYFKYYRFVFFIVLGTEVVLEACKANSVPILIYCSSISIYVGHDEVKKGTETTVPIPHKFMFEKYAKTKLKAQNMVLGANGDILKNGK